MAVQKQSHPRFFFSVFCPNSVISPMFMNTNARWLFRLNTVTDEDQRARTKQMLMQRHAHKQHHVSVSEKEVQGGQKQENALTKNYFDSLWFTGGEEIFQSACILVLNPVKQLWTTVWINREGVEEREGEILQHNWHKSTIFTASIRPLSFNGFWLKRQADKAVCQGGHKTLNPLIPFVVSSWTLLVKDHDKGGEGNDSLSPERNSAINAFMTTRIHFPVN